MTKTIIRTLSARNRHFTIVQDEQGFYCAIEDKYITDGKLNTTLNGFQMHASKDLDACVKGTIECVEIEYLMDEGYTKAQAFAKVYGYPIEVCNQLFA